MEENFDALESLFEFGSCTYTTSYKDHKFAVTIRVVSKMEQFYNYVFIAENIKEVIFDMLDRYLEDKQCDSFSACMWEHLPLLEIPVTQIPVFQLNSLEIRIKSLRNIDCYHTYPTEIVDFNNFMN